MSIKMGVPKAAIESTPLEITNGIHKLKLSEITVKKAKNFPESVNYAFVFEVMDITKDDGSHPKIRQFVSSKAAWVQNDISHGLGIPLDDVNGQVSIPGEFDGPADDPEKWQYRGPLVGRTGDAYLEKEDKYSNIKYWVCAISECATRFPKTQHSKNLLGNKK